MKKTLAILLAVTVIVGFGATASLASSVTYPGVYLEEKPSSVHEIDNPNRDQQAACEKQGRTFVQHSDGNWYCDLPVNRGALIKELAQPGIHVEAGTYGGNCGQQEGNVTAHLANACNGKSSCEYSVDYTVIGDPAPGCQKDYVARWTCSGGGEQATRAGAEAGYGSKVLLICQQLDPSPASNGLHASPTKDDVLKANTGAWSVIGYVRDQNHVGVPGLTVSLCDENKLLIKDAGYSGTDNTGYFKLSINPGKSSSLSAGTALGNAGPAFAKAIFIVVTDQQQTVLFIDPQPIVPSLSEVTYREITLARPL